MAKAHAATGAARHATAAATTHAGARAPAGPGWFQVPAGVYLHPGHTWARLEADGLVAVGADDFAHKLVGAAHVELPGLGEHVMQGEPALEIGDGEKSVPMLSPVDGTVVAVNTAAKERPDGLSDPYGAAGCSRSRRPASPRTSASSCARARPAASWRTPRRSLALRLAPELGRVLQDGGTPVNGIARALSGDGWDQTARQFFLT